MQIAGLIVIICVFAAIAIAYLSKKAGADRDWAPALSRVATFEETEPFHYLVNNVRAFEYGPEGSQRKEWESRQVNAQHLSEVWFFIEPFGGSPLFAHSYLSFVFETPAGERQTLAISIEARKELNNAYSPLLGAFRAYELLYVWSTEKDVHSRIAIKLDHELLAYKLTLPQEQAIVIFDHFVKRTNELAARPRFYNTLHSNCTNELAKAVNDAYPGALPWHRSWVMTGRSAKWLHRLGFIGDPQAPFSEISADADIQALVKAHSDLAAEPFADAWRAAHATNR